MQSQTEHNMVVGSPESLDGDSTVIRRIRMRDSKSDYTLIMDMEYKRLTDPRKRQEHALLKATSIISVEGARHHEARHRESGEV